MSIVAYSVMLTEMHYSLQVNQMLHVWVLYGRAFINIR